MKIGLIDVDGHNFPNIPLMKISAWHKAQGHSVEWYDPMFSDHMDRVYMSKVFTFTPDYEYPIWADEIYCGGSGYCIDLVDGREVFDSDRDVELPPEIEHIYPDYSIYFNDNDLAYDEKTGECLGLSEKEKLKRDTAYGFLTRGCPRGCHFCHVVAKEGRRSRKVADLSEFWNGQKNIVLCDPNLLAYRGHMELLRQLIDSKAWVNVNQGFDCRLLTEQNIDAINKIKLKEIHFAWDYMHEEKSVLRGLELYAKLAKRKPHGSFGSVYCLTNYDTSMEENLYRVYKLRDMGFDPYVMIYDKQNAPYEVRLLQRWCNNKIIFRAEPDFSKYDRKKG